MRTTRGVDFSLLSTNSVCSFCYDHVDHIIMHSTALTTNPPPPLLRIHGTHYIGIKQPLPHFESQLIITVNIRPNPALSSVNTYWPNAFAPSHEYLNIGVEKRQYTTFVPKNPC